MTQSPPSNDPRAGVESVAPSAASIYAVKLPVFEGPLDLLLHLIRLNEVEITEIPIALVGEQYLDYLGLMRELNLDVAGEYLVMAATLAWIKSRMLLPPEGAEESEEEADPRAELVARLLEYQRYKEVAEDLGRRELLGRDVFRAAGLATESRPASEREIEVGLFELLEAFRKVLEDSRATHPHEVEVEVVTVRERMLVIIERLEARESLEFAGIFDGAPPSRLLIVTTFLALLELARLGAARIYQACSEEGTPQGAIRLRREAPHTGVPWSERVSEFM